MQGYYNRYDPLKAYKELFFIAGRGLQSAELNELQAYLREDLSEVARALIREGGLLAGGEMRFDSLNRTVSLSEARLLHKSYVVRVPSAELQISGSGFPFLIGRLETLVLQRGPSRQPAFPFLIGRLETRREKALRDFDTSFHSS